jgi:hypothetical protein
LPLSSSLSAATGNVYGTPVHHALKLIRVLMTWSRSFTSELLDKFDIGKKILCYIAIEPRWVTKSKMFQFSVLNFFYGKHKSPTRFIQNAEWYEINLLYILLEKLKVFSGTFLKWIHILFSWEHVEDCFFKISQT